MKVLQWNIWYKENVKNIINTLKEINADVLCLQELTVNHPEYNKGIHSPQCIADALDFTCFFKSAVQGREYQSGNAIFSRFPIVKQKSHFIQHQSGAVSVEVDYSKENRIYLEVSVQTPDGDIDIATTHMSYTDGFIETPTRVVETDNLLRIISSKKEKFILAGDFNALPDSYTIREISKHLTNVGPSPEEKTWTTKHFSYRNFIAEDLDWRLDYCFATSDMQVKSVQIIQTNFSDHLPILIEL
jgi:endonuclease/exonuclease/phosphatase family metal-dependent hydrolase